MIVFSGLLGVIVNYTNRSILQLGRMISMTLISWIVDSHNIQKRYLGYPNIILNMN